jgi:anti-anti-sigma factor
MQVISASSRAAAVPTLCVSIPGDILSSNVESLRATIVETIDRGNPATGLDLLELDMRHATTIDAAGLGLLASLLVTAIARAGKVRAVIASPAVYRLIQLARFDKHLDLVLVEGSAAALAVPGLPTKP